MKKNRYELCGFSCRVKKMLFVMKLTILAFFLGLMSLSAASTYSQNTKITLDLEHMTLIDVFKQIEAQSDFVFIYKNEAINLDKKVDVKIEGATVDKILDQVLQDFGVKYEIIDKQIIITPNHSISSKTEEIKLTEGVSQPGKREISGMIKDPKGIPLPGVSIVIKGTTLGIVSDSEGKFKINVPSESKILVVSFIGMKTQEIIMGNDDSFNITLADEAVGLDEVVAVGYGTQRKGNLTGSIASIKTDKLTIAPISSTINALVGHLPGLVAKQSSGMPGSDASDLSIRGFGNALVIVDGIESTFNNLDANQIESVSILKDGAASIYGARAGNGVILVTTKRGQNQKPTITLNSSYKYLNLLVQDNDLKWNVNHGYNQENRKNSHHGLPIRWPNFMQEMILPIPIQTGITIRSVIGLPNKITICQYAEEVKKLVIMVFLVTLIRKL